MSRRILILIDDYNENRRIEMVLRKVGFDVVGLVTESGLSDQILSFAPDVIVASGSGEKLSAISIATKLREHRTYHGVVVLGFPKATHLTPKDLLKIRVDQILEAPFQAEVLIQTLAEILHLDGNYLVDKFRKSHLEEVEPEELQIVRSRGDGTAPRSPEDPETGDSLREAPEVTESKARRYRKIAEENSFDKTSTTFQKNAVREVWKEVKKQWDFSILEDLRKLKVEFAKSLFTKKKSE